MQRVIICGICGKMGQMILELARKDRDIEVVGLLESKGHPGIGNSIEGLSCKIEWDLSKIINNCDAMIDFTLPEATIEHLKVAESNAKAVVIGTTGLNDSQRKEIERSSENIPVVFSPNMSIGVNLLFKLVKETASVIPEYDVEIIEAHHNQKKDSPSGTADRIARIIAAVLGRDISKAGVYGRKGILGARNPEEIGIHAVRAGDIVGDHLVMFAGHGERLELVHRAHSRHTFAGGALRAAKWLKGKKAGLYDMQDVLGFNG